MIFILFEESYKLLSSAKCLKKVRIFPTTSFTYVKNNSVLVLTLAEPLNININFCECFENKTLCVLSTL